MPFQPVFHPLLFRYLFAMLRQTCHSGGFPSFLMIYRTRIPSELRYVARFYGRCQKPKTPTQTKCITQTIFLRIAEIWRIQRSTPWIFIEPTVCCEAFFDFLRLQAQVHSTLWRWGETQGCATDGRPVRMTPVNHGTHRVSTGAGCGRHVCEGTCFAGSKRNNRKNTPRTCWGSSHFATLPISSSSLTMLTWDPRLSTSGPWELRAAKGPPNRLAAVVLGRTSAREQEVRCVWLWGRTCGHVQVNEIPRKPCRYISPTFDPFGE